MQHGAKNSRPAGNLVTRVSELLRQSIQAGDFKPGEKLPSEAKLTQAHGVSRTVVREAIAALRSEGLVEARQGAGVFVLEAPQPEILPFQNLDYERISSVIELLELRTAVEVEAAALAALRRSPQQEERIIEAHREVMRRLENGGPTSDADFALHLAIADAANNPRFREFLSMIGSGVIPRAALQAGQDASSGNYIAKLHEEHSEIIDAISLGDEEAARTAMRKHLKGSQARYRAVLRRSQSNL
ncbi:FadR/GntR family transcriptional regulator [Limoniibacter endophyticus]|uniref:GntR family transcriptional regulator n=1 Tax=Limoniibacter endophyticus TaxID=1565040 RepID=A0A8J3GH19_9HYPH|nr:FadR/GntR family transcriptional regulator [Limoniibacter endophyticus]GHC72044.1 GntR family transcriptional regulator [Limoniibacter endophyticus]